MARTDIVRRNLGVVVAVALVVVARRNNSVGVGLHNSRFVARNSLVAAVAADKYCFAVVGVVHNCCFAAVVVADSCCFAAVVARNCSAVVRRRCFAEVEVVRVVVHRTRVDHRNSNG